MRFALVSDIHGNLAALEAVIDDLQTRRVDQVVNLGDHVSGPLHPKETARRLMSMDWIHLAGNHERQLLTTPLGEMGPSDAFAHAQLDRRELSWLSNQAATAGLEGDVLLCHGTPGRDDEFFLETEIETGLRPARPDEITVRMGPATESLVACGHSHIPRIVRAPSGQIVVNPGSVGLPAYLTDTITVECGCPDARYAVVEKREGGWAVDLVSVPYDHLAMAELAERRGRNDWAQALRTGFIPS